MRLDRCDEEEEEEEEDDTDTMSFISFFHFRFWFERKDDFTDARYPFLPCCWNSTNKRRGESVAEQRHPHFFFLFVLSSTNLREVGSRDKKISGNI